MLFVDGCSLLRILDIFVIEPENIMFDKLYLVFGDVLLLENQLPFELLKLFQVIEPALIRNMIYFLQKFCFQYKSKYFYPEDNISMKPIHLLDLLRQILLPRFKRKNQVSDYNYMFKYSSKLVMVIKRKLVMNFLFSVFMLVILILIFQVV